MVDDDDDTGMEMGVSDEGVTWGSDVEETIYIEAEVVCVMEAETPDGMVYVQDGFCTLVKACSASCSHHCTNAVKTISNCRCHCHCIESDLR